MQESIPPLGLRSLSFILDEDSGELQAELAPVDDLPALDMEMLRQALADAGYGELQFYDGALQAFVSASRSAAEPVTMTLGKRYDGEFSLKLAKDLMTASLTLIAPQGGKRVDDQVMQALRDQGIIFGILDDQLKAALAARQCEDVVIAQGVLPQASTPARFDSLLAEKELELAPPDESAVILYADLARLLLVAPGDRLMRRIPAVTGASGTNVKGETVLAEPIADSPFHPALQGVAPAPDDEDLLLASIAGQPVLVKHGVSVKPVIEVANVDLSTGNIKFEGSVRVNGDVKAGMQLIAAGDVIINGMMEAAEIHAGGNVCVKGGVIGRALTQADAQTLPAARATIRCKGAVMAQFMEHADVEAAASILVEGSVRQCELVAGNEIIVGKTSSKAGQIIGGRAQAANNIKAQSLGSPAGIRTQVQVGVDPFLDNELKEKADQLQRKIGEMERVLQLIRHFKNNPAKASGGVGDKVEATRGHLAGEINTIVTEQRQLAAKNATIDHAQVSVGQMLHEGVEIRIGKQAWQVTRNARPCIVRLLDGKITTV